MEQLTPTVVTSNISNVSSPPGRLAPACWDSRGLVPAVMLSLCFLLGVPGNAAVIILKSKWQHLSSLSQTLMLNLAASDLLCLLTLPLWTYTLLFNWIFGLVACKLLAYLVYCSIYSSLLTVTMLSVQRYLQVVYLQRCLDQRRQKRLLGLLWLVAMILSSPTLVVLQLTTDEYGTHCEPQYSDGRRVLVLLEESLIGLVCLLVVMFAYISIQIKVNRAAFFSNTQTTRLVTIIIVAFFVLWMPYLTMNVFCISVVYLENERLLKVCVDNSNTVGALTFLNSCLNPLLYAFFASRNMCTMCQNTEQE